ncbi:hypothetical protein DL765_005589 [Monosporascus sp. GIB2]|nr:hypothetical protein DL765_005589 [Monosporascus sp. GIB2]
MATICLDSQTFYTTPLAPGPQLTSCSDLARDRDTSVAISESFLHRPPGNPPQLQDAHDPPYGGSGTSLADAILISGESDSDFDDGRSDNTFSPPEELLATPHNEVQSNCVAGTEDMDISATPSASGDSDAKEHSITGGADSDDESVSTQQQSCDMECSLAPSSASPRAQYAEQVQPAPASGRSLPYATISRERGLGRPRHPSLSAIFQSRHAKSSMGGDGNSYLSSARNMSREGTVWSDEDDESELATAEPTLQPADGQGQMDFWRDVSGHCNFTFEEDYRHNHPPVPDDRGEQDADCSVVPPQVQESRASTPRLPDDESNNDLELANEPFTQPSTSQSRVIPPRNVGRRRHCDTDDGEGYRPIVGSDTEDNQGDDVQPRRRKRRRISTSTPTIRGTVTKRQERLHCTSSQSRQAQRPSPKRWRHQRSNPSPPSSQRLTSGTEAVHTAAAKFEEWPLEDAVLKRVILEGVPTFQLQFSWGACTNVTHGDRATGHATVSDFSPGGRKSTKRGVAFTPGETAPSQTDDDAQPLTLTEEATEWVVERILGTRKRGRGNQVLVMWKPTWEPLTTFLETEALHKYEEQHGKIAP